MSRLTNKITRAQEALSEAESCLEDLYDKQRRSQFKRKRKALRKKLAKDPMYRLLFFRTLKHVEGLQ